jgi:thioredoxin-related protein
MNSSVRCLPNKFWNGKLCFSIASLFFLGLVILAAPTFANDEGFTEDVNAATKRAKVEKKDIIFLYTGSDWCPPCKKLESEVLSEKEFLFEASKHFVLVKFDFLKQSDQDPELVKQNEAWAKKFGVDSFPTIVLADKDLKPFAFAGYETGGFQNYLGLLEEARQLRIRRDENLAAAKGKAGPERAKLLDKAISEIREEIINIYYVDVVEEIVKLDESDELGLRTKWNEAKDAEMRKVIMTDILMVSRLEKPAKAISFIEAVMEEISFNNSERLQIYQMKLNLVRQLKDPKMTDAVLDEMIGLEGVEGETRQRLIVKKVYLMVGSGRIDQAMELLEKQLEKDQAGLYLHLAKGELLEKKGEHKAAVVSYDEGLKNSGANPDVIAELVSAKADSLYAMKEAELALQTLDNFSDDTQMPTDLRAESLLHTSMIMRDMKRTRQARLAENRAVMILESATERAEMQKIVDRLREKFDK